MSNLYGLVALMFEPMGGKLLDNTHNSSTSVTARKRYVSTVIHMTKWYEIELTPGSK
jgi:hypothetical protein